MLPPASLAMFLASSTVAKPCYYGLVTTSQATERAESHSDTLNMDALFYRGQLQTFECETSLTESRVSKYEPLIWL